MFWLKLAYKEIRNNPRFSLFFIFNLSLGLVGFIALNSFQASINQHISNRSRSILSADLDIRSTYELKESELVILENEIGEFIAKTKRIDFLSMIAGKTDSRLVQILAIDEGYPLYGEIKLGSQQTASRSDIKDQLVDKAGIWVQPEVITSLKTELKDSVTIGRKTFVITDTILETSTGFTLSGGFAYRIFMGLKQAKETGLIDKGSRRYHHYFYSLPANVDVERLAERLKVIINENFGDNSYVSLRTHKNAGRRLTRFLGYLNDYLGLVSLVALFLAGVGTAYLFRSYLGTNLKDIAILMMLGAEKKKTYLFMLIQLTALGTISAVVSFLLSFLFLPLLTYLTADFLPKGFTTVFSWQSVLLAFLMGMLGSILFCLPILNKINKLKPIVVFNENHRSSTSKNRFNFVNLVTYLPLLLIFWLISVWQSRSWFIGSIFIASLVGSFILLGFIGWGFISSVNRLSFVNRLVPKLALRNLYRNKVAVVSSFLAIGLGALLINLIPQIDYGLQRELKRPETTNLPSFFLFDIQPDQIEPLEKLLGSSNLKMETVSPWIEARLSHVNSVELKTINRPEGGTREQRRDRYMRRRTQNLSYRMELFDSESIVEGQPFSGIYNPDAGELPEISLDFWFAESLEVTIGDTLTFDVQGIPIEGRVVNLRRIQWQTMQPNFYVIFQPGVLEEAPSTFLATIYEVDDQEKVPLQNRIVNRFPNISMVDITMAVNKILEITGQISWSIQVMAFSAIVVGMIVVYSIARYNSQSRMKEINLLKVLGASFNNIRQIIILEFLIFGLAASLFGSMLSIAASWVLSYLIFDNIWAASWQIAFLTTLLVTALTVLSAYLGTRKALLQKPVSLLQSV